MPRPGEAQGYPHAMAEASADICAPWADAADACAPCDDYEFDPALLEDWILVASNNLWNLTGRRWPGICTDTIRPPSACGCVAWCAPWWPSGGASGGFLELEGGDGLELEGGGGGLGDYGPLCGCGCGGVSELILPSYPVVDVTEVVIDGVVVDPARYRIDDRQRLVYQPALDGTGRRSWPCCQRLSRAAGEAGTWSVTYTHGQEPPLGGVKAAASLGCQLALSCLPADSPGFRACRLPKRATSITRQQVAVALVDPVALFPEGLTGLPEVDLWVASVMKGDERRRGHVWRPGNRRARRTT